MNTTNNAFDAQPVDNGGPAFPTVPVAGPNGYEQSNGISAHDYFMAHAPEWPQVWFQPSGLLTPPPPGDIRARKAWDAEELKQRLVQWPAAWADEMLKRRRK